MFSLKKEPGHDRVGNIVSLPLANISVYNNVRKDAKEQGETKLAPSIAVRGVEMNIIVRPNPAGGYWIVDGESRYWGARKAGLTHIPAEIRIMDDNETRDFQMRSFFKRNDISDYDSALAIQGYVDRGMMKKDIAVLLDIDPAEISRKLKFLDYPDDLLSLIKDGTIDRLHIKKYLPKINSLGGAHRQTVLAKIYGGTFTADDLKRPKRPSELAKAAEKANVPAQAEEPTQAQDVTENVPAESKAPPAFRLTLSRAECVVLAEKLGMTFTDDENLKEVIKLALLPLTA